ncbi:hypothetical protein NL453_27680, partial [Klebsiella pneumoniae]|nr:hypothetical protein [Klebsiella pneumoniae]
HPGFDYSFVLTPFAARMAGEHLNPRRLAARAAGAAAAAAELGFDLPGYARKFLERLDDGGVDVNLKTGELEPLVARVERTGDRIVAAMV